MKVTAKDFLQGGAFAGIANLAVFILFTISVIFPFDWFQQLVMISILFIPGIIYYIFANRRTLFFSFGMLAGHIVIIGINLLLAIPLIDPFVNFIEPFVFGETGLLFGVEFVIEFFLRVIALVYPPIIHLIAHLIGAVKNKLKPKSTSD